MTIKKKYVKNKLHDKKIKRQFRFYTHNVKIIIDDNFFFVLRSDANDL